MFKISRNTCISDIQGTSKFLAENGFDLKVHSSNRGYRLGGREIEIRRAILYSISLVDPYYGDSFTKITYKISERFVFHLFGLDYEAARNRAVILADAAASENVKLSLQSAIYISACMEFVLKRLKRGCYLRNADIQHGVIDKIGKNNILKLMEASGLWREIQDILACDPDLSISERSEIECCEKEVLQQMIFCIGSIWEDYLADYSVKGFEPEEAALQLIKQFEKNLGYEFRNKGHIIVSLGKSLVGVLFRVNYKFRIYTPMTDMIFADYSYIYEITRKVLQTYETGSLVFPENETAYLTTQLLGWITRDSGRDARDRQEEPLIGIICANNVGIGVLVQQQIENTFSNIRTVLLPVHELNNSELYKNLTLIVSTLTLRVGSDIPVVRVNALLSAQDKENIARHLRGRLQAGMAMDAVTRELMKIARDFMTVEQREIFKQKLERLLNSGQYEITYKGRKKFMLKDLITEERIQFAKSVSDWREAIKIASRPLLDDNSITENYVNAMIAVIEKVGPYVVLTPGVALPHARQNEDVHRLAMSLLCVKERVYFSEEKYANLIFILASPDGKSHIDALANLSKLFSDDAMLDKFMEADTVDDIVRLISQ